MSAQNNQQTVRRFRSYGLWSGLFLGILFGVIAGGPRFREWEHPISTWLMIITSSAAVGAVVGYFFFSLLQGGTAVTLSGLEAGSVGDPGDSDGGGDGGGTNF